jgi:hypothetical protein
VSFNQQNGRDYTSDLIEPEDGRDHSDYSRIKGEIPDQSQRSSDLLRDLEIFPPVKLPDKIPRIN